MHASTAQDLKIKNWNMAFTTCEALFERIKSLAENGASVTYVYLNGKTQYRTVYNLLANAGYHIKDYGGNTGVLEIRW